ncbi:MAG TPA: DmsC/YnfH family molybdoenzyme membrane anchor subunit [Burkholderiales bacterium]|nr:DmsC/YnfH family molybdoenzyme membrane anchor subunit [Burkholderiales bacterium]
MRPALSVILLTTLIGTGQGLFLALVTVETLAKASPQFFWFGAIISLLLLGAGLVASFFHLGHPERAWRSAAKWRTSWLSREVIALPAFMAAVFAWGVAHWLGWPTLALGAAGALLALALYVCTAMIYACLPFLQEWHSPLTVVNYLVLGCASGFTLAAAYCSWMAHELAAVLAAGALGWTLLGFATRGASLARNARLKARSSLQSAIGVKHPRIAQKAQGAIAGSFNTREFFHGRGPGTLRKVKWLFLVGAFILPAALLAAGFPNLAFIVQFAGLMAERWFFFAQANHPQNLYYQAVS